MSPLTLRRYRAERLLEREFAGLEGRVIATVRRRLRGAGVDLDRCDLEACYATAWQGLYAAVLDGQEIANPAGWLVLVTFRRAIEEHRGRTRAQRVHGLVARRGAELGGADPDSAAAPQRDLADELDDRARLRELFEGLRGRLSAREREAAVLCYLQGLTRAQAAAHMGVSESRMRKLMEGHGPGRPGVAGKVGTLVETIRDGHWCAEQGSLMRGLAFGILDPDGERYRLAQLHRSECPACRAYVASLRGLAAALPPVLLPGALGANALGHIGEGIHLGAGATGRGLAQGSSAGTQAGPGVGGTLAGGLGTPAAAGAGAGGSGWLLAGGGKLAVGCVLALSVGAGCIGIKVAGDPAQHPARRVSAHASAKIRAHPARSSLLAYGYVAAHQVSTATATPPASRPAVAPVLPAAAQASREFGPEQALASAASSSTASAPRRSPAARAASVSSPAGTSAASGGGASGGPGSFEATPQAGSTTPTRSATAASSPAEREFSPG